MQPQGTAQVEPYVRGAGPRGTAQVEWCVRAAGRALPRGAVCKDSRACPGGAVCKGSSRGMPRWSGM